MRGEADEIVCLEAHADLKAIGYYYRDFRPVPDDAVIKLLGKFPARKQKPKQKPQSAA
jgi:putative phosphoribosyl transferase